MARIRTIKPEFPQSESMGRVSRDARLLFIMLWTLCDDSGRTRGNSRMLASLLFPYDDDANRLIEKWLTELERECCIVRYQSDGASYLQVCNWLNHQKIDKPSQSKIPKFDESSRILANPRELSCEDQGSRIKDQGPILSATPSGFAEFWSAYPKKIGKGDAEKAFKTTKASGHLQTILKAIESQKRSEQWQKDGGQFIPNPATWLRQRRWEDEPQQNNAPVTYQTGMLANAL